eukprot:scaffold94379_cov22-Tisochrysis_lutea.AAC.2
MQLETMSANMQARALSWETCWGFAFYFYTHTRLMVPTSWQVHSQQCAHHSPLPHARVVATTICAGICHVLAQARHGRSAPTHAIEHPPSFGNFLASCNAGESGERSREKIVASSWVDAL